MTYPNELIVLQLRKLDQRLDLLWMAAVSTVSFTYLDLLT